MNQVKQVIRGALQAVRLTKRVALTPDAVQSIWKPDAVSELVTAFRESLKFKASSGVLSMLTQLLGAISNTPKADRKSGKKKKGVVKDAEPSTPSTLINSPSKEEKIKKKAKRKAEERLDGGTDDTPVVKKKKKVKIDT